MNRFTNMTSTPGFLEPVDFYEMLASNVVIAAALALIAFAATRVWRNPNLAHALWLLVLIKLVTPPLISLPLPELSSATDLSGHDREIDRPTMDSAATTPTGASPVVTWPEDAQSGSEWQIVDSVAEMSETASTATHELAPNPELVLRREGPEASASHEDSGILARSATSDSWKAPSSRGELAAMDTYEIESPERNWPNAASLHGPLAAFLVWVGGTVVYVSVLARRCVRFHRVLAAAQSVDDELLADAQRLAKAVGLVRCPDIRVVEDRIPPLVWGVGAKPIVLLPRELLVELNRGQRRAVLVHELAHVRRRDYVVRWLEVLVLALFWWNPVAWWARRQLHQAEEEFCDAWVVWALPGDRRSYGQALLRTVEFLTEHRVIPAVAGSTFGGFLFKRRIEMILTRKTSPKMSWLACAVVLLLAAVVLPVAAQTSGVSAPQIAEDATSDEESISASEQHDADIESNSAQQPVVNNPLQGIDGSFLDDLSASEKSLEARIRRLEVLVEKLLAAQKPAKFEAGVFDDNSYRPRTRRPNQNVQALRQFRNVPFVRQDLATRPMRRATASRDGKFAAVLTAGKAASEIEIFDSASGRITAKIHIGEGATKFTFLGDQRLAVLAGEQVKIFDVPTGKQVGAEAAGDWPKYERSSSKDAQPSSAIPSANVSATLRQRAATSGGAATLAELFAKVSAAERGQSQLKKLFAKGYVAKSEVEAANATVGVVRAKLVKFRRDHEAQDRLLKLDVRAAELKLKAARAKYDALKEGGASSTELTQTGIAIEQAELEVLRASILLEIHGKTRDG